jgi:hypothetical protein
VPVIALSKPTGSMCDSPSHWMSSAAIIKSMMTLSISHFSNHTQNCYNFKKSNIETQACHVMSLLKLKGQIKGFAIKINFLLNYATFWMTVVSL